MIDKISRSWTQFQSHRIIEGIADLIPELRAEGRLPEDYRVPR